MCVLIYFHDPLIECGAVAGPRVGICRHIQFLLIYVCVRRSNELTLCNTQLSRSRRFAYTRDPLAIYLLYSIQSIIISANYTDKQHIYNAVRRCCCFACSFSQKQRRRPRRHGCCCCCSPYSARVVVASVAVPISRIAKNRPVANFTHFSRHYNNTRIALRRSQRHRDYNNNYYFSFFKRKSTNKYTA